MTEHRQIFDNLEKISVSDSINDALGKLALLKDLNSTFVVDSYSALNQTLAQLTQISSQNTINKSKSHAQSSDEVRQCAKWAIKLWNEALEAEHLDRLLVATLVIEYIGYPLELLTLDIDDEQRKRIALKPSIQLALSIPEDAAYDQQSMFRQYDNGIKNKDLGKLLSFFNNLERGIGIHSSNPIPQKLLQLIYRLHSDGIVALLKKGEPYIAELVIQSLESNEITTILADCYESQPDFPLVRGLVVLARRHNDTLKRNLSIKIPYKQLGIILGKLEQRKTWDTSFSLISNAMKWNPVFHYCCGLLVGNRPEFIDKYLEIVDFSIEENNYGSSFYNAIIASVGEESLDNVAALITEKYWRYLKERKHQSILNRATGYFNFICHNVYKTAIDVDGYEKLIADQFDKIETSLYSWFPNKACLQFQVMYYMIAANFTFAFTLRTDAPIVKKIEAFLHDERHAFLLSAVQSETIIKLLTAPSDIESLAVVYDNGNQGELTRNKPIA